MIVSHEHRFIFAAVPKTGTHSIREALRPQLGPDDVEQARLIVEKRFPWQLVERIGVHGAATATTVAQILPTGGHRPPVQIMPSWYYA